MSKRSGEELNGAPLKAGQRPENGSKNDEDLEFADEFEDEFSEDDEIMEAGVDGHRPLPISIRVIDEMHLSAHIRTSSSQSA